MQILLPGAEGEAKWVSDGATFFGMCKAAAEAAADKAGCPEGQIAFPSESARCSQLTATVLFALQFYLFLQCAVLMVWFLIL